MGCSSISTLTWARFARSSRSQLSRKKLRREVWISAVVVLPGTSSLLGTVLDPPEISEGNETQASPSGHRSLGSGVRGEAHRFTNGSKSRRIHVVWGRGTNTVPRGKTLSHPHGTRRGRTTLPASLTVHQRWLWSWVSLGFDAGTGEVTRYRYTGRTRPDQCPMRKDRRAPAENIELCESPRHLTS